MLDLGCGTGLAAEAFGDCCATIVGFDLSPAMLEQARNKQLYASLATADLVEALDCETAEADLIIAADAFAYLGDLHPVCRAARRVLARRGIFAFTTETHEGEGVVLGEKLRYAHSVQYVRDALETAGLAVISIERAAARAEAGLPVPGLVVVATSAELA
jgi:predicted TPR repeat methyltransferase